MSGDTTKCPACGGDNLPAAKFCGACGHGIGAAASEPVAAAPRGAANPKRTMLGMAAVPMSAVAPSEPDAPPAEPAAPAAPKRTPARTMMGMAPPSTPPPANPAEPTTAAGAASAAPPVETDASSAPLAPLPAATHRTMLGMPQVAADAIQQAQEAKNAEAAARQSQAGQAKQKAGGADPLGPTNRTMLGMQARPMTVDPAPVERRSSYPPRQRSQVQFADGSEPPPAPRKSSGKGALIIVGVLTALIFVIVVGAVGIYLFAGGDAATVHASVVPTEAGDGLAVEVPDAEEGTRVRFAGQELALEEGRVTFPLAADSLRIGDNELTVEVGSASGDLEAHTVTLTVSYRVRADVSALAEDPPALLVRVSALPGSEVVVGDEPVTLDAEGHGARRYEIDTTASAPALEHSADYRITLPDGHVHAGTVETRIPYAQLQIDRPGTNVVTEAAVVEIAGAIHPSGTVTIDGAETTATEGRFVHPYELPIGEREVRVVARQPGRAPRAITLSLRRVEDLAAEARSFEADASLDYARLSQNPTIYRTQRIALEGRVYNVSIVGGRSVLQVLVRDCPEGQRCPLWVAYSQATDVTVNDWVRVLGTVAGEQQFRSESDRVITVPRVDAQFILPARARR